MLQNQSPLVEYNKNSSKLANQNSMHGSLCDEDTLICSERINTSPEKEDLLMEDVESYEVTNGQQSIPEAQFSTE